MEPQISVVIPVYNGRAFLAGALESALSQTYRNKEVIVVDDGSTDGTGEAAAPYAGRIRYYRKENGGPSSSRNFGVNRAGGELIAFLDADDTWLPDKLARQADLLDKCPDSGLVFTDLALIGPDGKAAETSFLEEKHRTKILRNIPRKQYGGGFIYTRSVFPEMLQSCFMLPSTVLVKKSLLRAAGFFDEKLAHAEDYKLWLQLSRQTSFGCIPNTLACKKIRPAGLSQATLAQASSLLTVFQELAQENFDGPKITGIIAKRLASFHFELGYFYFQHRQKEQARQNFRNGFRKHPTPFSLYWLLKSLILG